MAIDSAEMDVEWDSGRRVLVAPFKIVSGANRITLLAHVEPPNDNVQDWQLGFSGGTDVGAHLESQLLAVRATRRDADGLALSDRCTLLP